jgi:hypothetical protein
LEAWNAVPFYIVQFGFLRTMRWFSHNVVLAIELIALGSVLGLLCHLLWWGYRWKPPVDTTPREEERGRV